MSIYNKILLVIDLSAESSWIIERGKAMADGTAATLTLLHVVEYVPLEPMGETVLPAVQMEAELVARAKEKMASMAAHYGLADSKQIVTVGSAKMEIQHTALDIGADLVVVGNHERHGLKALVNFIEDTVLHISPCDVLAVHLPNGKSA